MTGLRTTTPRCWRQTLALGILSLVVWPFGGADAATKPNQEEEHPGDKRQGPRLTETIVAWKDIGFDYDQNRVTLTGHMIENTRGKDAIVTMDAGVLPGLSLRGFGESVMVEENGRVVEEVQWLRLTGFDLVMGPSFHDAGITKIESEVNPMSKMQTAEKATKNKPLEESEELGAPISAARLMEEYPDVAAQVVETLELRRQLEAKKERELQEADQAHIQKKIAENEAALRELYGLDETADLQAAVRTERDRLNRLEEAEVARQTQAYVEEQLAGLKTYPDWLRKDLSEAIKQAAPKTIEEAKKTVVEQRKIFDSILANLKLRQKGFGLEVLGPMLESETGVPEFARAAFEITEALRTAGKAKRRRLHEKDVLTPAETFALAYLKRFDENYKTQLAKESREFAETETTADLSLPYSVMRVIAEEAYPELIASNVFDFGVMNSSPTRVYYESQFTEETGYSVTVTGNNNVNAAAFDTWYDLANARIDFSPVSMQPSGGGTELVYGTDYVIDFEEGRYKLLSTGGMSTATNYDFDYTYKAVRKGENQPIERAKATLAYTTLEAIADRLALQITREAIVFSRSQLGWDAVTNSINLLIKELRLLIERNLFGLALSQVLSVPNNIGGIWNSSSDSLTQLVQLILNAKTKVENRQYMATGVVMSKTMGNNLVLWDGFTQAGSRNGFRLNGAPGFLGDIGEIPVWTTTEMPDTHILVCHEELIQHRVFQAMQLYGPFPVYHSSGKLIAANEYYVEEFNGTISPIPQKGSVVLVS